MRLVAALIALLSFIAPGRLAPSTRDEPAAGADARGETLRRYSVDPASPLESRVGATPTSVLTMFDEPGTPAPTPHTLTDPERAQLTRAIAALPPLHRRVLAERLRTLSFLDGMPNTALTSTVNPDGEYRLFDITFRASIFRQSVSEWLTEKERTCFDTSGSSASVSIEAGTMPAIVYALIHEATHVVDSSLGITPRPPAKGDSSAFTRGVWDDNSTPVPRYRDPLLESVRFRNGGRVLPIGDAGKVYEALVRTPFASLYGSRNWSDDLAECVALYALTQKLGQPYRIVLRGGGGSEAVYEPTKTTPVLTRADQMAAMYRDRS
jgi:hypothetical protein